MAKESKVSPTLHSNDESDDDDDKDVNEELFNEIQFVYASLHGNDNARAIVKSLMVTLCDHTETINDLDTLVKEGKMSFNVLKQELCDEKHTNSLLYQSIKSYELEKAKSFNDACATNSTSYEASILKENVKLRAQLELLTSNYKKLEENHVKLSGSHEALLISYDGLKLACEASITKETSCEPHVDISTTSTQNDIMSCASPNNSSTHNIATSCDELLAFPCCSNNEASTSSSTCIVTNHVEEIKDLKAQVTSLKKDLEKCHGGKSTLANILNVQKSPNDKSGLGFNSNNKNNFKSNNKKGQDKVKNPAKIICFKCKVEGHHVRSCPLKKKEHLSKKQQGKRPQGQAQAQTQVEDRPLPKNNQDQASQVKQSTKKRKGSTCCYICREKVHLCFFMLKRYLI
jgi:hypothetical protein